MVWLISLLPWLVVAGLWGMVFDAGSKLPAYVSIAAVWSYPVSIGLDI
jgi:hypothetical protein